MIDRSPIRSDAPVERLDNGRSRYVAPVQRNRSSPGYGLPRAHNQRVAAQAQTACGAPESNKKKHRMMSRSATATYAGRASSMRRLRRRATSQAAASRSRPYCRTNGCASFLEVDPARGVATCPVCGYTRRAH
jgi:hypothetical protein